MTRNEARDRLMQMIFQMEAQDDFSSDARDKYLELYPIKGKQREYVERVHRFISEKMTEINELINSSSNGWKTQRMAKADLAIIRVAIAEVAAMEDVPESVAINEAVELAKKYGSDNSPKFVNGLLGKAIKDIDTII